MNAWRSIVWGVALCLTIAVIAHSATAQTLQIKAGAGDLPPGRFLSEICEAPAVRDAVLDEFNLKLLEQSRWGSAPGGNILTLRDESGNDVRVVFSLVLLEEEKSPPVQWALMAIYPFDDGTTRTEEQQKALQQLCAKMTIAWAKQLEAALEKFAAEGSQREEQLGLSRLRAAHERLAVAEKELEELRANLQDAERQVSMPAAVLEKQLSEAMSQQQSLELELAGLQARHAALEEQIAQLSVKATQQAEEDEVIKNLKEVVELRTAELAVVRQAYEAGQASGGAAAKVAVELATAKAELAEARRDAAEVVGGGTLEWLQTDLAQCTIRQQESRGKQEFARGRAEQLSAELRMETTLIQPLRDRCAALARRVESLEDAKFTAEVELERAASQRQPVQVRLLMLPQAEKPAGAEKN